MKTTFKVCFYSVGLTRRDEFALCTDSNIRKKADGLREELAKLANAALPAIKWQGSFPSTPKERKQYEEVVLTLLVPVTFSAVVSAIAPVLKNIDKKVRGKFERYLGYLDSTVPLAAALKLTNPQYELRSRFASACIPVEPPPGGHIISGRLFYEQKQPMRQEFTFSLRSGDYVYSYLVDCDVKTQLEE